MTAYELACGSVQSSNKNGITVKLWKEHNVYHVRAHDLNEHLRLEWSSFKNLTLAQKEFRNLTKKYLEIVVDKTKNKR